MDALPPAIGARLFRSDELLSEAPQLRASARNSRGENFSANPGTSSRPPTFTSPASALPRTQSSRSLGGWDTPVDPLQLVWLHGRAREDFEGF